MDSSELLNRVEAQAPSGEKDLVGLDARVGGGGGGGGKGPQFPETLF